jgi:hypothetical protein
MPDYASIRSPLLGPNQGTPILVIKQCLISPSESLIRPVASISVLTEFLLESIRPFEVSSVIHTRGKIGTNAANVYKKPGGFACIVLAIIFKLLM